MTPLQEDVKRTWERLPAWAKSTLYLLDKFLNFRFGGDPTMTISERLARDYAKGGQLGALGCDILDRFDQGHCDRLLEHAGIPIPPKETTEMKPFWKSKTLWVNVATLGLHYAKPYIGVSTIPDVNPEVLAVANIVLRLITKGGLSLS